MKYALKPDQPDASPVASDDLPDQFAAETWAVAWAKEHAKDESYTLERDGGDFRALVFRTVSGQWYVTPKH